MSASAHVLVEIATRFAALSLVAIGGINAILPEIHRVVVDVEGWMTSGEFADLFALAQLAPGPNAMVVALVGWKVAGVAGALAPIAIGLILASGYTLARGADRSPGAFALTLIAAVALAWTRVNPVWVLLVAGVAGLAGLA